MMRKGGFIDEVSLDIYIHFRLSHSGLYAGAARVSLILTTLAGRRQSELPRHKR